MDHHKLFDDKAELYESSRPTYPTELYEYLSSLCPSHRSAWDCACGNGQAATSLVNHFDDIYATDISEEQIGNAKQHTRINYKVAPSETSGLQSESCDLVCVAQALHWFDHDIFWPEVLRVLRPGGIFSAWGYNWPILEKELEVIFRTLILDVVDSYWAPQNQLIWDHYKDIDFPFNTIVSPKPTMEVAWNLNEFFNFIHTFSATRRCIEDIGNNFFNLAYDRAIEAWGEPESKKVIAFDFVFYVGQK